MDTSLLTSIVNARTPKLQMLIFVLVDLLLIHVILASNDVHLSDGWIPIAKPNVYNQMRKSYIETRYASAWKPSQDDGNNNIDVIKADAIQIINPEQVESIQHKNNVSATVPTADVTGIPIFNNNLKEKDSTSSRQSQNQIITTFQLRDNLYTHNSTMDKPQRVSKKLRSLSPIDDIISGTHDKPGSNTEPAETKMSLSPKNINDNTYEVIEPTNKQDISQKTSDGNGYIYQKPSVVPSGLSVSQNQYTKKFVQLLSKYNIKVHDILNNYARSKLHHSNILHVNPLHAPSIPFRYNSLNHRPVDPLLAVLLSNYGFYLQGFYGLPNNYKNLYGYSASNNIHNNKPFGSYKIYSDTDSFN